MPKIYFRSQSGTYFELLNSEFAKTRNDAVIMRRLSEESSANIQEALAKGESEEEVFRKRHPRPLHRDEEGGIFEIPLHLLSKDSLISILCDLTGEELSSLDGVSEHDLRSLIKGFRRSSKRIRVRNRKPGSTGSESAD